MLTCFSDGRITDNQIFVSDSVDGNQYPRLNISSWNFTITDPNQIMSLRVVFPARVIVAGLRIITRRPHKNPVQVKHKIFKTKF